MGDVGDGWQTIMPRIDAARFHAPRHRIEGYERQVLREWETVRGSWSGIGKHTHDFAEAKKLHSRFRQAIEGVLGSGTYGIVEKVQYNHGNRSVCLARKRIHPRRGRTIQILREEADVMERLDHDHIVKLVGSYSIRANELFLLIWPVATCNLTSLIDDVEALRTGLGDREDIVSRLEALQLGDLSAIDQRAGATPASASPESCPLKYLQQIIGCITEAVAYCHRENIRHLDLKPSNILLAPGTVYLADFGIARDVNDRDHTMTVGAPGSPRWRAPELRRDREDEWSMKAADIYSLGLVLLSIATILHGANLADFDNVLDEPSAHIRAEKLREYQVKLQLLALATQEFADHNAHTFGPKQIVALTSRMVAQDPKQRPTVDKVSTALVELGGIDQAYHSPCCKKASRVVTALMDTRYKLSADESTRLRLENERMARRLQELEGRDETYLMRLDNEKRKHAKNLAAVQKQLEDEQRKRERLEAELAELQGSRRQQRPGIPRPERSSGGGASACSGGLTMRTRPHNYAVALHDHAAAPPPAPSALQYQRKPSPIVSFHAKSQGSHAWPNGTYHPEPAARTPTDLPVTNGNASPGGEGFPLRSRGSGSRLPVAVNPSTPIRSRSGTPAFNRNPSLTDSTQLSMSSSTFSRISAESRDSESAPGSTASPGLNGSPFAKPALRNGAKKPLPVVANGDVNGAGLDITRSVNGSLSTGRDRNRDEDTVSVESSSVVPGTASPVLTGSAFSSPRAAKVDLHMDGVMRVPSLPTAKSWADVARR